MVTNVKRREHSAETAEYIRDGGLCYYRKPLLSHIKDISGLNCSKIGIIVLSMNLYVSMLNPALYDHAFDVFAF